MKGINKKKSYLTLNENNLREKVNVFKFKIKYIDF